MAETDPLGLEYPGLAPADLVLLIYGKEGELRWSANNSKAYYFERKLTAEDIAAIRKFTAANKSDRLAAFDGQCVDGIAYVYLHLTAGSGRRVCIKNPPQRTDTPAELKRYPAGHPAWQYTELVEFFGKFKAPDKVRVHYCFPPPAPKGFEIVYAHPRNEIRAVWKQGKDLCVAVNEFGYSDEITQFRKLVVGKLGAKVADPKLAEVGCSSPDGRWVLKVDKHEDLECYDTVKKVRVAIADEQTRMKYLPLHFVEARQAFILARFSVNPFSPELRTWFHGYRLLDPATGRSQSLASEPGGGYWSPANGAEGWKAELWLQRLPRRMQPVKGEPKLVWAASPEDYFPPSCRVGYYDAKDSCWLGCQSIPFFQFQTKDVWVDEEGQKIYAIYAGHLLAFPLDKDIPAKTAAIRLEDKVYAARGRAFRALRAKHFDAAIAGYSEAIALNPKDPELFRLRVRAYHEKGDLAKAIVDAGEVIRLDPRTPKAFSGPGWAFLGKRRL